ncbi:hypothetical protein PCYB_007240, partial [Plasmodium cynomolgi strain B]
MKLVRNLGCYNYEYERYNPSKEDCIVLYYWIYSSLKKLGIEADIITPVFYDNYSKLCTYNRKVNCFYYDYYDNFLDPLNMIFLDIFQHNIDIIKKALDDSDDKFNDKLQKYICECIYIYKLLHNKYCANNNYYYNNDYLKRKNTCSMLNVFKYTYDSFLREKFYKKIYVIPYIEDLERNYSTTCIVPESELNQDVNIPKGIQTSFNQGNDPSPITDKLELPTGDHNEIHDSSSRSRIPYDKYKDEILRSKEVIEKIPNIYISPLVREKLDTLANESNSTGSRRSTTTALSTVGVVSSALALLYKV